MAQSKRKTQSQTLDCYFSSKQRRSQEEEEDNIDQPHAPSSQSRLEEAQGEVTNSSSHGSTTQCMSTDSETASKYVTQLSSYMRCLHCAAGTCTSEIWRQTILAVTR